MIKTQFDPAKACRYVRYGRMSSDMQNPRSPEQQFDTIDALLRRAGNPWAHAGDYRDDGISGRFMRKRPGFRKMIEDIEAGRVPVDLVLVDTFERFGRAEECESLRRSLQTKYGVLVLTADSGFTDPTSVAGKALAVAESFRSTADKQTKSHDVLRGKIDAAREKHWPGGVPPMGYCLESVMKSAAGPAEVDYRILVPNPVDVKWPKLMFALAREKGYGSTRIAKHVNSVPEFVQRFGKIDQTAVGYILDNPIYKGVLRFNRVATDLIDDCRVQQRNEACEIVYVENYCEPLVSVEDWDSIRAMRARRADQIKAARLPGNDNDRKQIAPLQAGIVLKYPLSGLVRCAKCGAAMVASKSGAKDPEAMSYYYYRCPGYVSGACTNRIYVPGNWLWTAVVAKLRERLFPLPAVDGLSIVPSWVEEIILEVTLELERLVNQRGDERPVLERELSDLDARLNGWMQSLSNPALNSIVRQEIERKYGEALKRKHEIDMAIATLEHDRQHVDELLDPQPAMACLQYLDCVLAGANPTEVNNELMRHIERIEASEDGRIVMFSHALGIFEGLACHLSESTASTAPITAGSNDEMHRTVTPRALRQRRKMTLTLDTTSTQRSRRLTSAINLPDRWLFEDIFQIPEHRSWAEEHAREVAAYRLQNHATMEVTAAHFGKTVPTVRAALEHAKKIGIDALGKSVSLSTRPNWAREHAAEVAEYLEKNQCTPEAAASHFKKSAPTIRKARDFARMTMNPVVTDRGSSSDGDAADLIAPVDRNNSAL